MEKQFSYNGQTMNAFWNGKVYGGKCYVEVKNTAQRYGHGCNMVWDDVHGWTKNGGMPYAKTVASLFGFK